MWSLRALLPCSKCGPGAVPCKSYVKDVALVCANVSLVQQGWYCFPENRGKEFARARASLCVCALCPSTDRGTGGRILRRGI